MEDAGQVTGGSLDGMRDEDRDERWTMTTRAADAELAGRTRPDPARLAARDAFFEQLAHVGKAFASPKRLQLLGLLIQGERTVDALARAAGLGVTTASAHLQVLRSAGLVTTRRDGTRIHYRPAGDDVADLLVAFRTVATRRSVGVAAAVEALLADRTDGPVDVIGRDELLARAANGEVTVLDVRPADEFAFRHLAGARSVPLDTLTTELARLPRDTPVVAYCRGPWCLMADDAVRLLVAHGFTASRLDDGVAEWSRAGLPVAVGT